MDSSGILPSQSTLTLNWIEQSLPNQSLASLPRLPTKAPERGYNGVDGYPLGIGLTLAGNRIATLRLSAPCPLNYPKLLSVHPSKLVTNLCCILAPSSLPDKSCCRSDHRYDGRKSRLLVDKTCCSQSHSNAHHKSRGSGTQNGQCLHFVSKSATDGSD